MPGSIAEFKSSFTTDLAKPSRFDVSIPIPLSLVRYRTDAQRLNLRCENAELPSRTFATFDQKYYGPVETFPYLTTFNQSNFTFIVGDDMKERYLFDKWMELINPSLNYNFRYKDDYAVSIQVNQYDVTNKKSYSLTLINAFPVAVNQLDLDWSSDGYHKLTVVFAYSSWVNNDIKSLGSDILDTTIADIVTSVGGV